MDVILIKIPLFKLVYIINKITTAALRFNSVNIHNCNYWEETRRILSIVRSLFQKGPESRPYRRDLASRSRAEAKTSPLILGPNRTDSLWYKIKG